MADARKGKTSRRGFALIASLTLMVLLSMVAMGVLAIVTAQNNIASQLVLQAEARQQALLGLDAAIADLQVELGPDQRVTASSGILEDNPGMPQHILGVWNSWDSALYATGDHGAIAGTYNKGRSNMFRRWLISSSDPQSLRSVEAVKSLSKRSSGRRILLVGEGTLGRDADINRFIYADLISMPASGKNEACFAWWVGGENQKANVGVKPLKKTTDNVELLRRTWDTPPPSFTEDRQLSFLYGANLNEPGKIVSLKTLPLVTHSATGAGTPFFFDVTVFSYSLPINVRDGGLKHDINLLLNKKSLRGTPYAARSDQDCPIAEGEGLPTGTESNMPIGSWQVMHAYHNMWPDGSGRTDQGFSARLSGSVSNAYTRMSGHLVSENTSAGDAVTYYDTRAVEGDASAGYANAPVLLAFMGAYGLAISEPRGSWRELPATNDSHGVVYAPFTQWWNPYNVQMRVGGKKLWLMSLPYRTHALSQWTDEGGGPFWHRYQMIQSRETGVDGTFDRGAQMGQGNCMGDDWGNYLVNSVNDRDSDIVFEPGEILVFSMSEGWNNMKVENQYEDNNGGNYLKSTPVSRPQAVPFVPGDNFGELHFYSCSLYSYGHRNYSNGFALESKPTYDAGNFTRVQDADVDYKYNGGEYAHTTVGEAFGPHERESFVVPYGYDGIDASSELGKSLKDSRLSSKPDRFVGARGISPFVFSLGWYDRNHVPDNGLTFISGARWSTDMEHDVPDFYAAVGVVPKSINRSLNDCLPMFRGKDYRTKVWQHSNPAMGGSHIYRPDDQQRQYHPFQLATVEMGTGLDRGVLDTPNNRNGVYGLSSAGAGGGESTSFIACFELPVHPPFSLAGFAGMRLSPGWYQTSSGDQHAVSLARMRRMQYQAGVPGVGIGNAFADPCLPAGDVYAFHQSQIDSSLGSNSKVFSDFYDHGLIINDALWDRWFCSSMSDMPTGHGRLAVREVVEKFVNGRESLPVSRYKLAPTALNEPQIIQKILEDDGWMHVARYLMVEGGFNVNSVSEEAWTAILLGLSKRELLSNSGGDLHTVKKDSEENVIFSRFAVSTTDQSIDGRGYNVVEGSSHVRANLKLATAWGEIRSLSPDSIRELAREIVKQVRLRGPFLNMSDFINRRLDGGSDTALTGALQAAIDATDINEMFKDSSYNVQVIKDGNLYSYAKAEEGSMYTAAPGYLIQSDVLASLGNILTVRDDTFVVRAYGCVRSPAKAVLAQAWCEAVVQRTMEYVDPTNAPEDSPRNDESRTGKHLTDLNRLMGRRFRVVSFRWLDAWDI